jgi:hypothetical protein
VSNCEQTYPTLTCYVRPGNLISRFSGGSILKASTNNRVKAKFRKSKGETNGKFQKLTNDPTLEGRDENKVGRIERKIGRAEKALAK